MAPFYGSRTAKRQAWEREGEGLSTDSGRHFTEVLRPRPIKICMIIILLICSRITEKQWS